jgi:hypothetical protein
LLLSSKERRDSEDNLPFLGWESFFTLFFCLNIENVHSPTKSIGPP